MVWKYYMNDVVDWFKSNHCSHVAMESTGDYWKPIYNLLELEDLQPMVVNAQHIKAVRWNRRTLVVRLFA